MVNIGFSVLKASQSGKALKLDPPALKTPPSSPDVSEAPPPSNVVVRKHLVQDEYKVHRLVPNVSLISDITFPQAQDLENEKAVEEQQHDPPGKEVREIRTDLEHEFRRVHTPTVKKDPPANREFNSSMSQSIVTRVLGIVDIGCVSPFSERENNAHSPPRISYHVTEWGIPPSETIVSTQDMLNDVDETKNNSPTNDSSRDDDVVVCITPDETQQAHLQITFPPQQRQLQEPLLASKSMHPTLEHPPRLFTSQQAENLQMDGNNRSRSNKNGWSRRKESSSRKIDNKNEKKGNESLKVETILGTSPSAENANRIKHAHGSQHGIKILKRNSNTKLDEKNEKNYSRSQTPVRLDLSSDSKKASRSMESTPRVVLKEPVIEPAEYRQPIQASTKIQKDESNVKRKSKRKPGGASIATNFFRKSNGMPTSTRAKDNTNLEADDNKLKLLKSSGKKVIEVFQAKLKKDADSKTTDSTVSESLQNSTDRVVKAKTKFNSVNNVGSGSTGHLVATRSDDREETHTRFVPATEADGGGNGAPRIRKVLKSIKASSKLPLETVDEAAEDDLSSSSSVSVKGLRIRIPGIHFGSPDSYIRDKDLIGDEFVEEVEEIVSFVSPLASKQNQSMSDKLSNRKKIDEIMSPECSKSPEVTTSHIDSNRKMLKSTKEDVVENKNPEIEARGRFNLSARVRSFSPPTTPNKSWKDFLGISAPPTSPKLIKPIDEMRSSSFDQQEPRQRLIYRNQSAPQGLKAIDVHAVNSNKDNDVPEQKVSKPMWKAVTDPSSGRIYYYHKQTRQTTWTKPPEFELIQKKMSKAKKLINLDDTETTLDLTQDDTDVVENHSQNIRVDPVLSDSEETAVQRNPPTSHKPNDVPLVVPPITVPSKAEGVKKIGLREISDSKPFDEPIPSNLEEHTVAIDDKLSIDPGGSIALSRTVLSLHSGFSGNFSSGTQSTQLIRNTTSGKAEFPAIAQDTEKNKATVSPIRRRFLAQNNAPIPKNIPVPRCRELTVEEFTTRDPVFGAKDSDIRERKARAAYRNQHTIQTTKKPSTSQTAYFSFDQSAYNNNFDNTGEVDKDEASYEPTIDTVSALSEADLSFITLQESLEMTRRRALHEALAQKDWDRAADISETMRMDRLRQTPDAVASPSSIEWTQGPIDRYVSVNDFDGITDYIAQMRLQDLRQTRTNEKESSRYNNFGNGTAVDYRVWDHSRPNSCKNYISTHPKASPSTRARIGARSQLQHSKGANVSYSSYSSRSSYTSDQSSSSTDSEDEDVAVQRLTSRVARNSGKEFVC